MIYDLNYPDDFDELQCRAFDAAMELDNADDPAEIAYRVDAIRAYDFELIDADTFSQLGYHFRKFTGVNEDLECYFDWKAYGKQLCAELNGDFTSYGFLYFY